jgi:hypothetical protein
MREVLFPCLIRLRADDELAHELVEAARQDKGKAVRVRPLRAANAPATRRPASGGRSNDDGPEPLHRGKFLEAARGWRCSRPQLRLSQRAAIQVKTAGEGA